LCAVPSTPFCTTATINDACPRCLVPSVAETAGACNAACPQCLVPFLAETTGACCQTQLARDVLCPRRPRPLGLAVHTVSLPAMSKPLWHDRHSVCCEKISSSPAMFVPSSAVTTVGPLTKTKKISSLPAMSVSSLAVTAVGPLTKQKN
jgi:hypothetical protein